MEPHDPGPDPFADLMADVTPFPDQAMWLRYNSSSGAARTGLLTPDALAIVLRDLPLDPNWSSIVALGNSRIAFFRHSTSLLTIGQVDALGAYSDISNTADAEQGHSVFAVDVDTLLFALSIDGGARIRAVTGRINPDGSYQRLTEPFLLDFWTHIVPVGNGFTLFYNAHTRLAATGRFGLDGSFTDLVTLPGFDPWTHIHAATDGTLLFHNVHTGAAASGRINADGNVVNLFSAFLGIGIALLPTRDGRMVVLRAADTLVARFGGASGWFADARVINGQITPLPALFVR